MLLPRPSGNPQTGSWVIRTSDGYCLETMDYCFAMFCLCELSVNTKNLFSQCIVKHYFTMQTEQSVGLTMKHHEMQLDYVR